MVIAWSIRLGRSGFVGRFLRIDSASPTCLYSLPALIKLCRQACLAKDDIAAFCAAFADNAESAAAVHVATTEFVEHGEDPSPKSSRPPDVQLLRTWPGERRVWDPGENHRAVWKARPLGAL